MKNLIKILVILLFALFVSASFAQEKQESEKNDNTLIHQMEHNYNNHQSHYISEINNEIKALTNEELNQLLNGEGMGLAKAAELNNYPGPRHVLNFSSELKLTREQYEKSEALLNTMKTEAKHLGESIIKKEKELDLIFKDSNADEKSIRDKVMEISLLKGKLRFVHLDAHLKQKEILSEDQVSAYNKLRGYN